jgi:soluble lytic murein transglycosylase-like protein
MQPAKINTRGVKVGEPSEGNGHVVPTKVVPANAITSPAVGAVAPALSANVTNQSNGNPIDYNDIIKRYASEYDLDPKLIRSMIAVESGFNSKAVSPKGAQGLMQLMPETAARLGVSKPFDPVENISGGTRYMRFLLDTFSYNPEDYLILSLAAYNAGENLVQRLGRIPDFRETNEYVNNIIQRYGSRKMEVPVHAAPAVIGPSTFDYLDDQGVRTLTNIPPVDRSKKNNPTQSANSIFR